MPANGEDVSGLGAGRNGQFVWSIESRHIDRCAECGLGVRNWHLQNQMLAFTFEQVVFFDGDEAVAVAVWSTVGAGFTFALQADSHAVVDPGGDLDVHLGFFVLRSSATAFAARFADLFASTFAGRASRLDAKDAR